MTHPTPSPTREEVERRINDLQTGNWAGTNSLDAASLLRTLLDRAEKVEAERDELAKWTATRKMEADGWRADEGAER